MNFYNNRFSAAMIAAALAGSALCVSAGNGVQIDHLGVNNTLVRITGDGKYIILPIQEANDDAKINIVVDGKTEKVINARLAKSKVDYTVPVNIEKYKGHDVLLNIITQQSRASVREAKEDVCWNGIELADTFDTANREQYRPAYHHTPLYGWMNDPNGMVYKDGVWHLCYQWNPYGSKWQNLSWGQSTSKDLIHWDHQADAVLEPDGLGMIFSGSAAIDKTGSAGFGKDAVVALYTSADASQIQSLASSADGGMTYTPYPGNPVLPLESEARDPNMFWDEANGQWVLTLAHALDHEMLIFTSPDLKKWTLQSSFGKGLGSQDGVWECPDLFQLPVEGSKQKKWVLICNINPGGPFGGSATQYFVGDFDGKTFTVDKDKKGEVPTKWLDYGKDHYATVSFSDAPDGRRTVIGWMSNWQYAADVPTKQFRSANTLPREIYLFKAPDGEIYAASAPSPELLALRGDVAASADKTEISAKPLSYNLPANGLCEITLDFNAGKSKEVTFTLANDKGEQVVMTYNTADRTFSFDRTKSGLSDFSDAFAAVTTTPTYEKNGKVALRIFIDRSSIELFGNNGKFVMTNLVFPTAPYTTLSIASEGNATLTDLNIYSINE